MLDLSGKEWDYTAIEKYAIKWFNENGYEFTITKRYLSKTVFVISKCGCEMETELSSEVSNKKLAMEMIDKQFEMYKKLFQ